MIPILVLGIVLGFTVLAPKVRIKYGSGALWLVAAAASLLVALVFAFLQPTYSPEVGSFRDLFFWSALIAAGAGFASLALLVPRWHNRPQRVATWVNLVLAVMVWLLSAAAGILIGFVGTQLIMFRRVWP